jgi:type VI secretion system protein ImpL
MDNSEETVLLPHAIYYCESLKHGTITPLVPDRGVVSRGRSILSQIPQRERLYDALVRDANTEIAPIRREAIFHGSIAPFIQGKHGFVIDGAYTKQGWERVRALLGTQRAKLEDERWVLAEGGEQGHNEIEELRTLYFDRYRGAWKAFIADLQVQDPGNADVAIDELTALSEPEWPYLRLIKLLHENVSLDLEESSLSGAVAKKGLDELEKRLPVDAGTISKPHETTSMERAYRPILLFAIPPGGKDDGTAITGLTQYQQILGKLIGILTEIHDAGPSGDAAQSAAAAFQEAFRSVNNLLAQQDGFTRPLLAPLLIMPLTYAWSNVVHDAGAATGAKWESQVWQRWHDSLYKHYPFDKAGPDAALNDFVDFFAPESGALFSFYNESLKTMIDENDDSFTPSRRFKVSLGFSPVLLNKCLKHGHEIATTLFPPKSEVPSVAFEVNLHSVSAAVSDVTFEVDGVSQSYRNEPQQWTTMTWPGKTHGAKLKVKGAGGLSEEISRTGDFGLFHLLDSADLKTNGRTAVATWELKATGTTAIVKMDIRFQRTQTPFDPSFFANYDCPRSVSGK